MPFTFRKPVKVFPGTYVNLNKRGVSVTQKVGPVTTTRRRGRKARVTVNLPGPVGYTTGGGVDRRSAPKKASKPKPKKEAPPRRERVARPDRPNGFDPYS